MKREDIKLIERPLKKEDLPQLAEVFFLCFNKKVDLGYFQWKFYDNPAGDVIGTVSCDGDKIAGFYGIIPEDYIVNDKEVLFYQAIDGMVHPNYQGLRIFAKLSAINSDNVIKEKGDSYFLGYPGDQSFPVFINKIGWKNPINIKFQFTNKLLHKTRRLLSNNEKFKMVEFNHFDERFDTFFLSKEKSNFPPIQKKITKEFLNWRCFSPYTKEFKALYFENENGIAGYVIYKMEGNRCFLHFIDSLNKDCYTPILDAFCNYIFNTIKASFIFCFEATNPTLKSALRKNGFIFNPLNKGLFSYRPPLILHSNKESVLNIPFFDAKNWDIQGIARDY